MFGAALEHIKIFYPGRQFSEVKYIKSVHVAGDSVATFDLSAQGADAVLLEWLYWVPTVAAGVTTWTVIDQFKNVLFQLQQFALGVSSPVPYPITAVKNGPVAQIIVPSVGGNFLEFSISYQFLMIDGVNKNR